MAIRILDVGQCGFDGPRMAELWHERLGATVDRVNSSQEALDRLSAHQYHLILVNRVLADDGSSGLEAIEALKDHGTTVPVMLVSNFDKSQDAAVALGAVRGFGKDELGEQSTLDLVKRVAGGR